MESVNENARPGDESGRAQSPQQAKSAGATDLEGNDAARDSGRKPSFADQVGPLIKAGLTLIPVNGKAPRDPKWQLLGYDSAREAAMAEGRHNLGVRIPRNLLVVDVDPRNGGDESFARLVDDCGIDVGALPVVRTGGGGLHVYLWLPDGFDAVQHHATYPGIDFKTSGQVVAPGSVHPGTRNRYVGERMELLALEIPAPERLRSLLKRPERQAQFDGGATRAGELTPAMLTANLAQLDPNDYGQGEQDMWLELMMACHHATDGAGRDEFIEWSTSADGYADHAEIIGRRWDSLRAGDGGVTVATLFKRVLDAGGTPVDRPEATDDFEAVEMEEPAVDRRKRRKRDWRTLSIEDLLTMPPPRWIVEGALQEQSAAVLFGPPGEGKSFVALDIALCMAAGIDWHGHAVVPGNVLYVAAEGAAGLGVRIQAWIKEHGLGSLPNAFRLFTDELTFADREMADDFLDFVGDEAEVARPTLIVVDTLSQTATGFEENSNTDMAKYFKRVQALVNRTGATVLVIHHTGKDTGKAERGAIAIRGNIDTSIEAKRVDSDGKRYVALHARKQKNDEERQIAELEMVRREFTGRDGTRTSSLVLIPSLRSFTEPDANFLSEELRLHDWLAQHMGSEEATPLGELLEPLQAARIIAGKERTLRTKLTKLIGEGFGGAKRCSDGTRIWLERDAKNPAKGPITVRKVNGGE